MTVLACVTLVALGSGDISEIVHSAVSQSDDEVAIFIYNSILDADSGSTVVSGIAFVTLDIGYNNGNEHIAVHRKGDFGLIDFGEQLAADVPALENIGRVKRYGCGKPCSLTKLVTA